MNNVGLNLTKFSIYKNLKYSTDLLLCYYFFSNYSNYSELIVKLLNKMFTRNSGRGQYRKIVLYFLQLLRQNDLNMFNNNFTKYLITLTVTGKFLATGRTQKMTVYTRKLPLHTLSHIYDYAESCSLTKAGVFSIKLWVQKL